MRRSAINSQPIREGNLKLHEYQSKKCFAEFGIPVLPGKIAVTPEEAYRAAQQIGGAVMVKAQVLVGNRMKKGGVLLAKSPSETQQCAEYIIGMKIEGLTIYKVLIEPAVNVSAEVYLGITNDRAARCPVLVASAEGGIDLEDYARINPKSIVQEHIDPLLGLHHYQATAAANHINLPREHWPNFNRIAMALYRCYAASDATLAEINPLVITGENLLMAVDGKMIIDDYALYRQSDLAAMRDTDNESETMQMARAAGIAYVKLDGQVGCMVNGAGLAMATVDLIKLYGGEDIRPANFLDIGGGVDADWAASGLRIVLSDPAVRSVLINIFGGLTHCDEVMLGVIRAYKETNSDLPLIVRLMGTNSEEGLELIKKSGIAKLTITATLTQAVQQAVSAARRS